MSVHDETSRPRASAESDAKYHDLMPMPIYTDGAHNDNMTEFGRSPSADHLHTSVSDLQFPSRPPYGVAYCNYGFYQQATKFVGQRNLAEASQVTGFGFSSGCFPPVRQAPTLFHQAETSFRRCESGPSDMISDPAAPPSHRPSPDPCKSALELELEKPVEEFHRKRGDLMVRADGFVEASTDVTPLNHSSVSHPMQSPSSVSQSLVSISPQSCWSAYPHLPQPNASQFGALSTLPNTTFQASATNFQCRQIQGQQLVVYQINGCAFGPTPLQPMPNYDMDIHSMFTVQPNPSGWKESGREYQTRSRKRRAKKEETPADYVDAEDPPPKKKGSNRPRKTKLRAEHITAAEENLRRFAVEFRRKRLEYGFSQADVGLSVGRRFGTDFSQTTISRFEAFNLSLKNMTKLRPMLQSWLAQADENFRRGFSARKFLEGDFIVGQERARAAGCLDLHFEEQQGPLSPIKISLDEPSSPQSPVYHEEKPLTPAPIAPVIKQCPVDSPPQADEAGYEVGEPREKVEVPPMQPHINLMPLPNSHVPPIFVPGDPIYVGRRRKKRTVILDSQREALMAAFQKDQNPHPYAINQLAERIDLDPQVVRVWFANRRQFVRRCMRDYEQNECAMAAAILQREDSSTNNNRPQRAAFEESLEVKPVKEKKIQQEEGVNKVETTSEKEKSVDSGIGSPDRAESGLGTQSQDRSALSRSVTPPLPMDFIADIDDGDKYVPNDPALFSPAPRSSHVLFGGRPFHDVFTHQSGFQSHI